MNASPAQPVPRLAVLISGGGRLLRNLLDRVEDGTLGAEIPLVIASRPCEGATLAEGRVRNVRIIPGEIPASTLERIFLEFGIDWAVLAGYLRLIRVPESYRGRIVNIHPSLLPRHGGRGMHGRRVHEAVLAAGDLESGCTVHLVDDAYDSGSILHQRRCPVLPGDTPEALAARVFEEELRAYPEALSKILRNRQGPAHVKAPHTPT